MITRRAALLGIGAALAAPAIVRAESLMRIVVPKPYMLVGWDLASEPDSTVSWIRNRNVLVLMPARKWFVLDPNFVPIPTTKAPVHRLPRVERT